MLPASRFFPLAAAAVLASSFSWAWSPETRIGMADDAIKLMPASLRLALETNRQAVLRGMLEPMVEEDSPEHRAPWAGGTLDERLAAEADALIADLGRRTPFEDLSERFGRLSHFVMDASFPPGVSDTDGDGRYADFAAFCESRRRKFPLVFYGHEDDALDDDDFREFALRVMNRARSEDRQLASVYGRAGDPPNPAAFDDRSIPFAVGSLSYSRCVTDIVRAWLAAWRIAGGDMGRTPYLEPPVDESTSGGP